MVSGYSALYRGNIAAMVDASTDDSNSGYDLNVSASQGSKTKRVLVMPVGSAWKNCGYPSKSSSPFPY